MKMGDCRSVRGGLGDEGWIKGKTGWGMLRLVAVGREEAFEGVDAAQTCTLHAVFLPPCSTDHSSGVRSRGPDDASNW